MKEPRHGRVDQGFHGRATAPSEPLSSNQSEFCTARGVDDQWQAAGNGYTGFGIIAVVAVLAGLATAGAGAQQQSSLALPRERDAVTRRARPGGRSRSSTRCARAATRPARSGCSTRRSFRYDPLKDKYIPWLATSGKWVGRTYVVQLRSGVKWSDGKPLTGERRQVHVRDRQARRLRALDDVEDRPHEHHRQGQHGQLRLQGQAELPRLEHQHLLVGHRSPAPLEELQRRPRSRRATPTSTWSAPARSPTAPARAPRARCSGTAAATGGPRRRSG